MIKQIWLIKSNRIQACQINKMPQIRVKVLSKDSAIYQVLDLVLSEKVETIIRTSILLMTRRPSQENRFSIQKTYLKDTKSQKQKDRNSTVQEIIPVNLTLR